VKVRKSITIDTNVLEKIQATAKEAGRSFSNFIEELCKAEIKRKDNDK